jgi:hypothetical protein
LNDLEDELSRILNVAADRAPRAPAGLAATVKTRYRRRRAWSTTTLAAVSVVALIGGAGVAVSTMRTPDVPQPATGPTSRPTSSKRPVDVIPPPIEKVWPQAVRKIPAKLPDGRDYSPELLLDDRTLLAMSRGFGTRQSLWKYDLDRGTAKRLAEIPTTGGLPIHAEGVAAGGGNIVWWTQGRDRSARIWIVPVSGGTPRPMITFPLRNNRIRDLTIVGADVIFSYEKGGVYRVPLSGGKVRPVKGGEKQQILQWPWVGEHRGQDRFVKLVDIETGERRDAVVAADEEVQCDVNRCTGMQVRTEKVKCVVGQCKGKMIEKTTRVRTFIRNRDGSGEMALHNILQVAQLERFYKQQLIGAGDRQALALYDTKTGKSADLGVRDAEGKMSVPEGRRDQLITYPVGDEMYVLNLSMIK